MRDRKIFSLQLFAEGGGGEGQGEGVETGTKAQKAGSQEETAGERKQETQQPEQARSGEEPGNAETLTEEEEAGGQTAAPEDFRKLEESQRETAIQHWKAQRLYGQWIRQAEEAKKLYPGLDLGKEAKDPEFLKLLAFDVDVGSAYLVRHKEEILPAMLACTAQIVEKRLAGKFRTEGLRPGENGLRSQGTALTRMDVTKLSKADRQAIRQRVAKGEKIHF